MSLKISGSCRDHQIIGAAAEKYDIDRCNQDKPTDKKIGGKQHPHYIAQDRDPARPVLGLKKKNTQDAHHYPKLEGPIRVRKLEIAKRDYPYPAYHAQA